MCTMKERELKCLAEKSEKSIKKEASNINESDKKPMIVHMEEKQAEPNKVILCSNLLNELQRQRLDQAFNASSDFVKNACRKDIEKLENMKNNIGDIKTVIDVKENEISSLTRKAIDLCKDIDLLRLQNNLLLVNESKLEAEIVVLKSQLEEAKDFFNVELRKKYIAVKDKNAQLHLEIDQLNEATEKAEKREHYMKEAIIKTRTLFTELNDVHYTCSQKVIETLTSSSPATENMIKEDPKLVPSEKHSCNDDRKSSDQPVNDEMEEEYAEGTTVIKQEPDEENIYDMIVNVKSEQDLIPIQYDTELFTRECREDLCTRVVATEGGSKERQVRFVEPSPHQEEGFKTRKRPADDDERLKHIRGEHVTLVART